MPRFGSPSEPRRQAARGEVTPTSPRPPSTPSPDVRQGREGAALDIPAPAGGTWLGGTVPSVPCPGPHNTLVIVWYL